MKVPTSKLLALSKEFYISGESELKQDNAMAYMQAILKFHDAVEFCLRAIIHEYEVNHNKRDLFDQLRKAINTAIPTKELPFESQMDFLNITRGKVKHHASIPSAHDAQRCHQETGEFLQRVIKDYFNESFLTISRVLLIEEPKTRKYLEEAEKEASKAEYLEALILIKKAFHVAQPSETAFISNNDSLIGSELSWGFRQSRQSMPELRGIIERLANRLIEEINDVKSSVVLLMMGIDALKLRRFEEITPRLSVVANTLYINWNNNIELSNEIVKEASNFVVDMILLWQSKGIVAHRPDAPVHSSSSFKRDLIREETWPPESE